MLLMFDNCDSFTDNLAQYFGELGEEVRLVRNDAIDIAGIAAPARIVISPGPCTPGGCDGRELSGKKSKCVHPKLTPTPALFHQGRGGHGRPSSSPS